MYALNGRRQNIAHAQNGPGIECSIMWLEIASVTLMIDRKTSSAFRPSSPLVGNPIRTYSKHSRKVAVVCRSELSFIMNESRSIRTYWWYILLMALV